MCVLQFHRECVDTWLHQSNCCPLDGYTIYNPLTWGRSAGVRVLPTVAVPTSLRGKHPHDLCRDLFVPGVGLRERTLDAAPVPRVGSSVTVCLSSLRPLPPLALGRPPPAGPAHDLAVNSVRIERPRRTSDTELARTRSRSDRPRPLVRCHSLSLAPLTDPLVKGNRTGLGKDGHPDIQVPPPSSSTSSLGPLTAASQAQPGDSLTGLYVGGSPLGSGGSSRGGGVQGQTVLSGVPRRVRPLRKARPALGHPGRSEVTLWMTGVYISGPSPQKN